MRPSRDTGCDLWQTVSFTKVPMSNPGKESSDKSRDKALGGASRTPYLSSTSHARATRHLLRPQQLRESMAISAPPSMRIALIAAFQVALAVLIALTVTYLSPRPDLVGFPALGALAALFGRFHSLPDRRRIVFMAGTLLVLGVFIPSLVSWLGASRTVMVLMLALVAGGSTIAASAWRLGGPGAVIIVFAAGAALGQAESLQVLVERTLGTAFGAVVAWIVCAVTDHWRDQSAAGFADANVPPFRNQVIAGLRIAVGAAVAALIAHAAGWQHPSWAAIGATAVMQGTHLHIAMNRALQRMAGTVLGSLLAWAVLAYDPSFWALMAAIVVFQFVTEIIIGFNYAFVQVTVTPMALLMTHLASPSSADMPVERVLETVLGAVIGILIAVLLSSIDDRVYLLKRGRGE